MKYFIILLIGVIIGYIVRWVAEVVHMMQNW